jgi:YbbR domain-containing protein
MRNLRLKIISVVLATLLSLFVHYSVVNEQANSSVVQLIVPVEVQKLPRDLTIVWPDTRQVEITLRGPSLALSRLITSPPILRVEVPDGVQNRFLAPLRKEDLRLAGDIEVLSIRPNEFEFRLDKLVERTVPVMVPHIGQLTKGLQIESIRTQPDSVVLFGPAGEIQSVTSVETAPLDMRELKESTTRSLSVRVPGTLTEARTQAVDVHVEIGFVRRDATFRNLAVSVRGADAEQYDVQPKVILVELSGPEKLIASIEPARLSPFVTIPEATPEQGSSTPVLVQRELKVALELPAQVVLKRVEPEMVTITPKRSARPRGNTSRGVTTSGTR